MRINSGAGITTTKTVKSEVGKAERRFNERALIRRNERKSEKQREKVLKNKEVNDDLVLCSALSTFVFFFFFFR